MAESPTAAFILSLLAGIFVLIGGLVVIGIGALIDSLGSLGSSLGNLGGLSGISSLPSGLGNMTSIAGGASGAGLSIATLGEVGIVQGILTIVLAVLLQRIPARHQLWGALVLTSSVLSWVSSIGGLLVGFLLGLVGGVLAISWKPSVATLAPSAQIRRICPNCGTVIQPDAKFCQYCGKSLP